MFLRSLILILPLAAMTTSCMSVTVGEPNLLDVSGLGTAYVAVDAMPPWNGEVFRLGLFGYSDRSGEILSIDVWPLFGVGLGIAGARVRVLPLEVGAGVLFYEPRPRRHPRDEDAGEPTPEGHDPDEELEQDEEHGPDEDVPEHSEAESPASP